MTRQTEFAFWLTHQSEYRQMKLANWPKKQLGLCKITLSGVDLYDTKNIHTRIPITNIVKVEEETASLVNVLDAFRASTPVELHENPYYREFERRGRVAEFVPDDWNATTPPIQYAENIYFKQMIAESNMSLARALYVVLALGLAFSLLLLWQREYDGGIVFGLLVLICSTPLIYVIRRQYKRYSNLLALAKKQVNR